jgi:hypothetical protein
MGLEAHKYTVVENPGRGVLEFFLQSLLRGILGLVRKPRGGPYFPVCIYGEVSFSPAIQFHIPVFRFRLLILILDWSNIISSVLTPKSARLDQIMDWKLDREWSRQQPVKMTKDFSKLIFNKHRRSHDWFDDMKSDGEFVYLALNSGLGRIFVFKSETLEVAHVLECTPVRTNMIRMAVNREFLVANVRSQG